MARFFTADLHLGHHNIIRYSDRPFRDVEEMNRSLVDRWNAAVGDADEVWVLGDVALGPIDESLALVGQLAGRKLLLTGNHDRCWPGHGARSERWIDRYISAGFDEIVHGSVHTKVGDIDVVCCHFPYIGDSHDHDRYPEHRPVDDGRVLLHGHVHEKWKSNGRQVNVGVDVWNYEPVAEARLADLARTVPPLAETERVPSRLA